MSNYAAAMRQVIDQHTSDGTYVSRRAAEEVVAKLRATNPELLTGWLDEQAEHFVWQAINDRDRSTRATVIRGAGRRRFSDAVGSATEGDSGPLRGFLTLPYVVADGSKRPLAQLNRDDLTFVADDYAARAAKNAFHAAFIRAVAKKVKSGTVADHFTEEQIASMWAGLAA